MSGSDVSSPALFESSLSDIPEHLRCIANCDRSCGVIFINDKENNFPKNCKAPKDKRDFIFERLSNSGIDMSNVSWFFSHGNARLHLWFNNQTVLQQVLEKELGVCLKHCFGQGTTFCNAKWQHFEHLVTAYLPYSGKVKPHDPKTASRDIRQKIVEQALSQNCKVDYCFVRGIDFGFIISIIPRNEQSFTKLMRDGLLFNKRRMGFRAPNCKSKPVGKLTERVWNRMYLKYPVDDVMFQKVMVPRVPELKIFRGLNSEDGAPSLFVQMVSESKERAEIEKQKFFTEFGSICLVEHTHEVFPKNFFLDCSACGSQGHRRANCPAASNYRKGQPLPLHGDSKCEKPNSGSLSGWNLKKSAKVALDMEKSKNEGKNKQRKEKWQKGESGSEIVARVPKVVEQERVARWRAMMGLPEGCKEVFVAGDGHCFYRAVARAELERQWEALTEEEKMNQEDELVRQLRTVAADGLLAMKEEEKILFELKTRGADFHGFVSRVRRFEKNIRGEYAEIPEITLVARHLMRPIAIFQMENKVASLYSIVNKKVLEDKDNRAGKMIAVLRSGSERDAHYSFIQLPEEWKKVEASDIDENMQGEDLHVLLGEDSFENEIKKIEMLGAASRAEEDLLKVYQLSIAASKRGGEVVVLPKEDKKVEVEHQESKSEGGDKSESGSNSEDRTRKVNDEDDQGREKKKEVDLVLEKKDKEVGLSSEGGEQNHEIQSSEEESDKEVPKENQLSKDPKTKKSGAKPRMTADKEICQKGSVKDKDLARSGVEIMGDLLYGKDRTKRNFLSSKGHREEPGGTGRTSSRIPARKS